MYPNFYWPEVLNDMTLIEGRGGGLFGVMPRAVLGVVDRVVDDSYVIFRWLALWCQQQARH